MLLLLASLLCGVRPAAVQDVPSPEARRAEIVRLVVEHGAGRFETGLGGVAEEKPEDWLLLNSNGSPSYAEGSLEYAAALLMSGGDAARAAKIIDTVLAAQAAGGKVPGGFPWGPGAEPDAYATAYLAPWLAYIHQHLAGGLSEATRADVARALRPALGAAQRLNTRPADGLPFLTRTAAQASLGAALQDAGAGAKAAVDLAAWLRHVSAAGLPGAHRPSLATGIAAMLHWTWLFAPTPQAKADATAALEYLYRDLALRCQPEAGVVAGAVLDGRAADYALGTGPTRYLLYASFGRPELTGAEPFALFLAVPGFQPNAETVALAGNVEAGRTVWERSGDCTLTTHVAPRYALATMTGPVDAGAMPVVLTYGSGTEPGAYCTVSPLPARVAAVQNGRRALVNFDVDDVGFEDERLFVIGEFHLGLRSDLDAVLVNQGRYDAEYAVAVETRGNVVTERDGVYTALLPVVMGPATVKSYDEPVGPAELSWVEPGGGGEAELVLKLAARSIRAREQARNNYRIGLAIEVATRDEYPTVEEFAAAIYDGRRVKQETKAKRVKIGQKTDNPRRPQFYGRPVEKGDWIFETRIVQDMTLVGEGLSLELTEDLEQNQVLEQLVDGVETAWEAIYRSPALNHDPGDGPAAVLRAPAAAGVPPE